MHWCCWCADEELTITSWNLEYRSPLVSEEGLRFKVVLKRKVVNSLLTTYLPSSLLILITFATTYFKPIFFEAALTANLTIMLVTTTIFIGEMQMLPTTAYIKMIDIWLVFCQLVPFSEVVLLTAIEFHRDYDESKPIQEEQKRDVLTPAWVSQQSSSVCSFGWIPRSKVPPSHPMLVWWGLWEWQVGITWREFILDRNPEERVLPGLVLVGSVVYAVVATCFFYEWISMHIAHNKYIFSKWYHAHIYTQHKNKYIRNGPLSQHQRVFFILPHDTGTDDDAVWNTIRWPPAL